MTNHTAIINQSLQKHYGVSYAGAYARCIDAGMRKEDAEYSIGHLVQQLTLGQDPSDNADTGRVHSILSHPAGKAKANV